MVVDLAKIVEFGYEMHGKVCDDLVKVVESKYEIHSKTYNDLVKVVESEYEIHGKACDNVVKVVESRNEVHSMASEVNELSDVKDVDHAEDKQGRVLEVIALAPVDTE